MRTIASRFLSFEETLGAGLVKFAYFVLLALLVAVTVVSMINGIVVMFDDFLAGLGLFVWAPIQFLILVILLRVGAEVVLAILSIDDQITDTTGAPGPIGRRSASTAPLSTPEPTTSAAASSSTTAKPAEAAPRATKKPTKKAATKKATRKSGTKSAKSAKATPSASDTSGGSKGSAASSASAADASGTQAASSASGAAEASSNASASNADESSAAKTAEAAKAATRPSARDDDATQS